MNVDLGHLSREELQFVRLYALTLKNRYAELFNALQLMRGDIGITCPVRAALLGQQLQEMGADFEHALASLATKHRARVRDVPGFPSTAEIVQIIKVSFFKLVEPPPSAQESGDDKGWFSGHPLEWEDVWNKIQPKPQHNNPSPALTKILQAFAQLLNDKFLSNITYVPGFPTKKLPPSAAEMHQDYDDEYYEDENDGDEDDSEYGTSY